MEGELEAVYIAGNTREADFLERLLDGEGIEFDVTPEAFVHTITAGACFQGLMYRVLAGQAGYCRRLFRDAGLTTGIVGD